MINSKITALSNTLNNNKVQGDENNLSTRRKSFGLFKANVAFTRSQVYGKVIGYIKNQSGKDISNLLLETLKINGNGITRMEGYLNEIKEAITHNNHRLLGSDYRNNQMQSIIGNLHNIIQVNQNINYPQDKNITFLENLNNDIQLIPDISKLNEKQTLNIIHKLFVITNPSNAILQEKNCGIASLLNDSLVTFPTSLLIKDHKDEIISKMLEPLTITEEAKMALCAKINEVCSKQTAFNYIEAYKDGGGLVEIKANTNVTQSINRMYEGSFKLNVESSGDQDLSLSLLQKFEMKCTFKKPLIIDNGYYYGNQKHEIRHTIANINEQAYMVFRMPATDDKNQSTYEYFIQPLIKDNTHDIGNKVNLAKNMEFYYYDIINLANQNFLIDSDDETKYDIYNNQYNKQIQKKYPKDDKSNYECFIPELANKITTTDETLGIYKDFIGKTFINETSNIANVELKLECMGYYDDKGVEVKNEQKLKFTKESCRMPSPIYHLTIDDTIPYMFAHTNAKQGNELCDICPFVVFNPKEKIISG